MAARLPLVRRLRLSQNPLKIHDYGTRRFATSNAPQKQNPIASQNQRPSPPARPQSWLTRTVSASPNAMKAFKLVTRVLGYESPKQVAARRAMFLYGNLCCPRAEEEREFWIQECYLPPTFQSWFTITNLHIWLLTVRLRALPPDSGKPAIQGLIDHFFLDIEDRIRYVLQPHPSATLPSNSSFYTPPEEAEEGTATKRRQGIAPERIVTQQMKVFKEQWAGMGMAFDLGLVKGDMDMAGAVWRNLLGARGARGIVFPASSSSSSPSSSDKSESTAQTHFRRSINLVGGSDAPVKQVEKSGLELEEAKDDGSGVHDFAPEEADNYVKYPEVMSQVVGYVRRELTRLDRVGDEELMEGDLDRLRFGPVQERRPS